MTRDGKVWLNQSQISDLFGTSVQNVSYHIINIMKEKELDANSVIKDYLITASDGKKYNVICYSLEMILAIGYRVRTIRGIQFRQWATRHLSEYLTKGFTMDDERLKIPEDVRTILTSFCKESVISAKRKTLLSETARLVYLNFSRQCTYNS